MFRSLVWVVLISTSCSQCLFSEEAPVIRGTINVVLANENGIVALTDSRLSFKTPSGRYQPLRQPGQKLFQLDNVTVCAFAGFAVASLKSFPELTSNSAGILQDLRRHLASYPLPSFSEKLRLLSSIFRWRLDAIANVMDFGNAIDQDFHLTLTLAGYDADGTPKVGQVSLNLRVENNGARLPVFHAEELEPIRERTVGKDLVWELGGQKTVARKMLSAAALEQISHDPAVADFANSYVANRGSTLTVEQMKKLAIALARYTADISPTVGGDNQVAILERGKITSFQQAPFPEQQPMRWFNMVTGDFSHSNSAVDGDSIVVIKSTFNEIKQTVLDHNFFFSNDFVNSQIMYDGGPTRFDNTNQVKDCTLVLGPHANRDPEFLHHLTTDFKWKDVKHMQP